MSDNKEAMITYIRPSGNEIKVRKGPGTEAYAKANGWLTKAEVKKAQAKTKDDKNTKEAQ